MSKERKEINKEKLKALEITLGKIEKDFGKGTIMKLGDHAIDNIQVISTGSIGLDAALGIGGIPRGRVIEIYGPEASGKTTVCLSTIAEAQKAGGTAAFIDAEHALDPVLGADPAENIFLDLLEVEEIENFLNGCRHGGKLSGGRNLTQAHRRLHLLGRPLPYR